MSDVIRLFVGTSPGGLDYEAEAVFVHTARKFSSSPIEFVFMRQAKTGPYSGWRGNNKGVTPFSGFRWSAPAMCGFDGRAIYADVDFCWHADLAELWREDIPGVIVTKRPKPGGKLKTCCTLFDCAKAKGHIADLPALKTMNDPQGFYGNYFKERPTLVSNYASGNWNAIDLYDPSNASIKATHFSRIEHQCHLPHAIPRLKRDGRRHWYTGPVFAHPNHGLQKHFDAMLAEAQEAGLTYESFEYGSGVEISRRAFAYKFHKGETPLEVSG